MTPRRMTRSLRARAAAGERLLGTVIASPDPALAEAAGRHLDFLWIDLEHSPLSLHDVQVLCIAARAAGCAALVRVPEPASGLLTALLDIGVNGVIAPRVEDVAVASAFAASLRYPPDGSRGFADRRATAYGLDRSPRHVDDAPLCLVQVESRTAVERAAELARVAGVDGLVVGPNDLAFDLGVAPGLASPQLLEAIDAVRADAARAGTLFGIAAGGEHDAVLRALGETGSLLAYSADVRIYAQALGDAAAAMTQAWRAASSVAAAGRPKPTS